MSCNHVTNYDDISNNIEVENVEASNAEAFDCEPFCFLGIEINGPNTLYYTTSGNYSVDISNGTPPFNYLWNYTLQNCTGGDCSDENKQQFGSTNSTYSFTHSYQNYQNVKIEVWVIDDDSKQGYDYKTVTLRPEIP